MYPLLALRCSLKYFIFFVNEMKALIFPFFNLQILVNVNQYYDFALACDY